LRLNSLHGIKDSYSPVEYPKRSLDLNRKIDVPRSVDDVNPVVSPETGRRSSRNRNAALPLLLHPIHRRRTFVNLTHLVRDPGIVENTFSCRRLTGINVSHDANVSSLL
jgi:hypothetical protein